MPNEENIRYKYCFVPGCKSTTVSTPNKIFFHVPQNDIIRQNWLQMCRRKSESTKTVFYCCEDHFDFENDVSNIVKHQLTGCSLKLKKGVLPSRFDCQPEREQYHSSKTEMLGICLRNEIKLPTDSIGEYSSGPRSEKVDLSLQQNALLMPKVKEERITPDDGMKDFESSNLNLEVAVEEKILPDLPEDSCAWSIVPNTSIVIKQEIIETEDDESTCVRDSSSIPSMPTFPDASRTLNSYSVTTHSSEPPFKRVKSVRTDSLKPSEMSPLTERKITLRQSAIKSHGQSTFDSQIKTINSKKVITFEGFSFSEIGGEKEKSSKEKTISPRDELDTYGEYIVSKLRKMNPKSRTYVQKVIADAIVEVETRRYSSGEEEEENSYT